MTVYSSDAIESLNNAIAKLDFAVQMDPSMPTGSKAAVASMAAHWRGFWNSTERAMLPNLALTSKLDRYLKWYTRAWAISSPAARAQAPRPDQIDVAWSALALSSLKNWTDGAQEAQQRGVALASYVAKGAGELAAKTAQGAGKVVGDVVTYGLLGLGAWYFLFRGK
jgi:hypothetical protein